MTFMIYGAYGYTGALIVEEAARRGLRPVLAGRDGSKLAALGKQYGCEARPFSLDNPAGVGEALDGIGVVLNCAGPFSRTALPMAEACLQRRAHYLDITGEIGVFEALHGLHQRAVDAGVMLLPGVGFDVVPSDCLAVFLKEQLPSATRLCMAFHVDGPPSHGTMLTVLENMPKGAAVRAAGELNYIRQYHERLIPFAGGARRAMRVQWGDVFTAYQSTGIPNIEIYMTMPPTQLGVMKYAQWVLPVLGLGPVQKLLTSLVKPGGPDAALRARHCSEFWGEAADAQGKTVTAVLKTPESYNLTVDAALSIAQRVIGGQFKPGYTTPGDCYGADLVRTLTGTELSLL